MNKNEKQMAQAAELMKGTAIQTALVSTNSICQGEQVANLWEPLMQEGIVINFAHHTFRWDSEAKIKAHVHCVIVGFSFEDKKDKKDKFLFDNDKTIPVNHINAYLIDGPDAFVGSRNKDNDRAVMAAYGFSVTLSESEIVAKLFSLYSALTSQ